MTNATRDNNNIPVLLGTSNADGLTPLPIQVESNHSILIDDDTGGNLVDSYDLANYTINSYLYSGAVIRVAQSVTGESGVLNSIEFYVAKLGSPTGNIVSKIYAHSGIFGTSSKPTGEALAVSDNYDIATLDTSISKVNFTFSGSNKIILSAIKYVISLEYSGGDISNNLMVGYDNSSPTHGGNLSYYVSSWVDNNSWDLVFYLYKDYDTNNVRDDNMVPVAMGVSSSDGITPVAMYIDSGTNKLLINSN